MTSRDQAKAFFFLGRWSSVVKRGKVSSRAGLTWIKEQCHFHHPSDRRTSQRIWVAFFALKSSGVSSSTVSPLPFTPSSRSFLYSFYAAEEEQRHCREGHTDPPGQSIQTKQWASFASCPFGSKSPNFQKKGKPFIVILKKNHFLTDSGDIDDFGKNFTKIQTLFLIKCEKTGHENRTKIPM